MALTRRDAMLLGASAAASALAKVPAASASNGVAEAVARFTGGAEPMEGGVLLDAPEIADNGGSVQVRIAAEGAKRIALFADGNPNPDVATFAFERLVSPAASIRIRLAGSQRLIAVAESADGTYRRASRDIIVTVGGCG